MPEIGIGGGRTGGALGSFVEPGHYFARDERTAVDLQGLPPIDVAVADARFAELVPEVVGGLIASVTGALSPGGRFFANYRETAQGDAIADAVPHRMQYQTLGAIARAAGARAERIGDWGDPSGRLMVVFTRDC